MRIHLDVRITLRVDIALAAIHVGRSTDSKDETAGFHIAIIARQDLAIVRLLQERWQPANLELRAAADDEVRATYLCDQAGPCLDVVRIL
jgi:hypothetical protein